ncbi:hypothetical protein JYT97_00045 [Haliea sp. AH-315-K21]|uniref:Uncharacterized protein n=1 Tax=SAR86 cluster bacterium TaxID=2030880 RepID=A0A2A5CF18_9GAMM|nr:hypothetical protein [Haliea sp. AH-315-K21]MBN4075856.1 hypothetical protein [Gammaproteobacteria bacterium AH-315-E17]PCJ42095.1 MAG: hypothetical protein COA71_05750 [SAR86 cluster bacterium]
MIKVYVYRLAMLMLWVVMFFLWREITDSEFWGLVCGTASAFYAARPADKSDIWFWQHGSKKNGE